LVWATWSAWAEILPTVLGQRRDPGHDARRELPPGAGGQVAA
jgi:hypothetical protein